MRFMRWNPATREWEYPPAPAGKAWRYLSFAERVKRYSPETRRCRTPGCDGLYEGIPREERVSMRNFQCPTCGGGFFRTDQPDFGWMLVDAGEGER